MLFPKPAPIGLFTFMKLLYYTYRFDPCPIQSYPPSTPLPRNAALKQQRFTSQSQLRSFIVTACTGISCRSNCPRRRSKFGPDVPLPANAPPEFSTSIASHPNKTAFYPDSFPHPHASDRIVCKLPSYGSTSPFQIMNSPRKLEKKGLNRLWTLPVNPLLIAYRV